MLSKYQKARRTKKSKAADYYGVPESEIVEVRVLVPKSRKDKIVKYSKRREK
jgi:hypothetical protein